MPAGMAPGAPHFTVGRSSRFELFPRFPVAGEADRRGGIAADLDRDRPVGRMACLALLRHSGGVLFVALRAGESPRVGFVTGDAGETGVNAGCGGELLPHRGMTVEARGGESLRHGDFPGAMGIAVAGETGALPLHVGTSPVATPAGEKDLQGPGRVVGVAGNASCPGQVLSPGLLQVGDLLVMALGAISFGEPFFPLAGGVFGRPGPRGEEKSREQTPECHVISGIPPRRWKKTDSHGRPQYVLGFWEWQLTVQLLPSASYAGAEPA